jgi:hypothetical protein
MRVVVGIADPVLRTAAAELNAAALLFFAVTVVLSAIAWRRRKAI